MSQIVPQEGLEGVARATSDHPAPAESAAESARATSPDWVGDATALADDLRAVADHPTACLHKHESNTIHVAANAIISLAARVATAERERREIVQALQQRLQPAGSPPPGGAEVLALWIIDAARAEADALRARCDMAVRALGGIDREDAAAWLDDEGNGYLRESDHFRAQVCDAAAKWLRSLATPTPPARGPEGAP